MYYINSYFYNVLDRKPGDIITRHRSHTISKMMGDHHSNEFHDNNKNHESQFPNPCGYDSFLHATICSNENNLLNSTMLSPKHEVSSKPNRTEIINAKNKTRYVCNLFIQCKYQISVI